MRAADQFGSLTPGLGVAAASLVTATHSGSGARVGMDMRLTNYLRPAAPRDEPGVLHIGGRGRGVRAAAQWGLAVLAVAGVLVGFFVWFGATLGCAVVLVAIMLGYMGLMAVWAGNGPRT